MLQKTELIECSRPVARSTEPNVSGASGLPAFRTFLPYSMQYPGSSKRESGVKRPVSSAALAVTTLKVEPGVKSPSVARLSSGAGGEQDARMLFIAPKLLSTRFGSKVGREAATSTAPVRVSSATTEPQLPA